MLRFLVCLFALLGSAFSAQSGPVGGRRVLLSGSTPTWVLNQGGTAPTVDCSFITGLSFGNCSLTVTRALANATNLLPSSASGYAYTTYAANTARITPGLGLLVEEARVNQLFNSTAPATQTTPSLANATYTLWVNGAGSATMSAGTATGCGTGVATQGTPVNFTTSGAAGTCVVTVAGALNAFQLEAGTWGTSLIVTAGATATRAVEIVQLAKPPTFGGSYTFFVQGTPAAPNAYASNQRALSVSDGSLNNRAQESRVSGICCVAFVVGGVAQTAPNITVPTWNQGVRGKAVFALATNDQAAAFNNSFASTSTVTAAPAITTVDVGNNPAGGGQVFNGFIERVTLWPTVRIPNGNVQSLSN